MDDPFPMGDLQSFSDLNAYLKGILEWQWPISQPLSQGLTLNVFHANEILPIFRLGDFIDVTNVRMIECSGGPCLPEESFMGYFIIGKGSW
jgi:hypothetical protein